MNRKLILAKEEAITVCKEKLEDAAEALREFLPDLAEELNWFLEELAEELCLVRGERLSLMESGLYGGEGNV